MILRKLPSFLLTTIPKKIHPTSKRSYNSGLSSNTSCFFRSSSPFSNQKNPLLKRYKKNWKSPPRKSPDLRSILFQPFYRQFFKIPSPSPSFPPEFNKTKNLNKSSCVFVSRHWSQYFDSIPEYLVLYRIIFPKFLPLIKSWPSFQTTHLERKGKQTYHSDGLFFSSLYILNISFVMFPMLWDVTLKDGERCLFVG